MDTSKDIRSDMKDEIWKDVVGYEGKYQISSIGLIKSIRNHTMAEDRILKPGLNWRGYLCLSLCKNGKYKKFTIHRLVALAFIPRTNPKLQVNHKNGIKTDNRVENLEWCTCQQNALHAWATGINRSLKPRAKLNQEMVDLIREIKKISPKTTAKSVADELGLSTSTISDIWLFRNWNPAKEKTRKTKSNIPMSAIGLEGLEKENV